MAIRRPLDTNVVDITGADLASDIAISTTGNIATTGSGSLTVAGNTTLSGTNNLGSNPTVTLGSNTTFPKGVSSGVSYLLRTVTSGTTTTQGDIGGTGVQIVPFTTIKNGTEDSAFTQNILSLSSSYWTMNTGYYIWDFLRPAYRNHHVLVHGIRTYGDSSGSGTSIGSITTDNVNFGSMIYYDSRTYNNGQPYLMNGTLKVSSTSQKYGFYINQEEDTHAGGGLGMTHSSTHTLVRNILRFIKIGEV